jgi:hypothetical protein
MISSLRKSLTYGAQHLITPDCAGYQAIIAGRHHCSELSALKEDHLLGKTAMAIELVPPSGSRDSGLREGTEVV